MQIIFGKNEIKALRGAVLYVVERDGVVTYVGVSTSRTSGMAEIFRKKNHQYFRNKALAAADKLTITTYDDLFDALLAETLLIRSHRPVGNTGDGSFTPTSLESGKPARILANVVKHMTEAGDSPEYVGVVIDLF